MPKLPEALANKTDEQESGSYAAIPDGVYVCALEEVRDTKDGRPLVGQKSGEPYWTWVFKVAEGQPHAGRLLFTTTSLQDNALWKLKEVFTAFGYDSHSDTDELVGEKVKLVVTSRPIESGARMGQIGNNVETLLPYEEGEPIGDPAHSAAGW